MPLWTCWTRTIFPLISRILWSLFYFFFYYYNFSLLTAVTNLVYDEESAFTALGYAIRNGDVRTVREILEGDEFNHQLLKKADYAGNTAVHLAAVGPEPAILLDLLGKGASVHVRNMANNTPLYLAEKMGNVEGVRLLKEAGAHLWVAERDSGGSSEVGSVGVGECAGEVGVDDGDRVV